MNLPQTTAIAAAQPGWFGSAARPRFAWLHRAWAPATGVGLVIVPPFGFEAVYAQRAIRHLAEDAARAGVTVVRADLDGSGDSAGDDRDPGRMQAWLASIDDACALARDAGATTLVLAGIRLGAALAMHAAMRRSDIAGLVAIAAVTSGKAWLREGRALQMALGQPSSRPRPADNDVQEIVGFALSAETRAELAQVDLADAAVRPAPAMLVIDRDDLPANDRWVAQLRGLGAEAEHRSLPGYVEMMLEPHRTEVPQAIIDATIGFATSRAPAPGASREPAHPGTTATLARCVDIPVPGGRVVEEAVDIDDRLFGIASRPPGDTPTRAVLLLNAGAVGRIGPNRMHVTLGRELARRGQLALRLDLSGIGDSAPRPGAEENIVYGDHAMADVAAAVAWARRQGAQEVSVAGLCSGAYHAFKAALQAQPIDRIVVINPLTFHYVPGMPLDYAAFQVIAEAKHYKTSMRSVESWKKLLKGNSDIARIARVMAGRASSRLMHATRNLLRRTGARMRDDLGSELLALDRRGVAIRFIFASPDPGHAILAEQGGSAVGQLVRTGTLGIAVIDDADHTFTPLWSHPLLVDAVLQAVAGPAGS